MHKSSTTLGEEILAVLLSMCMPEFNGQYAGPTNSRGPLIPKRHCFVPLGDMAHRPVKTGLSPPTLAVIWLTDQSKQD